MKNYMVSYDGLRLGGEAIVRAKSSEKAIELVGKHYNTVNFDDAEVVELPEEGVLLNRNGDY